MSSSFETLPTEILQDVCAILDIGHPTSLLAFARASKHCYSVASTVLFRTVKVAIPDHAPFRFLRRLKKRLLRDHAFEHVRRLILCAPEYGIDTADRWPYLSLERCERAFEHDTGLLSCWDTFSSEWDPNETTVHNWKPVIRLVKRLSGLTDIYWVCHEKLPLRLLNVLDSRTKLCRLHHYTFNLESSTATPMTSYDHALTTSTSLYSIGNLNGDTAAFQSARNIQSPNLRRVYLHLNSGMIQHDYIRGDEHQKVQKPVPREVIHMTARGTAPILFSTVQAEAFGDLSALRVLQLHHPVGPEDLPSPNDFPSLDTLIFICPMGQDVTPQGWDELAAFLRGLPRLTTLDISYWDRSIPFTPALNKNFRTLKLLTWAGLEDRRLHDDHIHHLADLCPHLETLDIEVPRSRGDAAEVSCYRSLGRLARLLELHIKLSPSPPKCFQTSLDGCSETTFDTVIEPWFDEEDAKYLIGGLAPYRQGHVRDTLINQAVDEGLARAIFQVISDTKLTSVGQLSLVPLERLKLCASRGRLFPGQIDAQRHIFRSPIKLFTHALDKNWLVKRDIRDDAREVLHAHEIGCMCGWDMISDPRIKSDSLVDASYWVGIWRRVWPAEKEGVDWWEDWKSRPLALGDDGNHEAD